MQALDAAQMIIDPDEAEAKLREYEELIAADRTAEDDAIAAGYRAARRGLGVISLQAVFGAGGFHADDGLPRLAVARATDQNCFVRWDGDDLVFSDDGWHAANRGALVGEHSVRVVSPQGRPTSWRRWSGSTMVPITPPRFRPRRPRRLSRCHVLWEVDHWQHEPPRDPALLRHIRGDLWAVLAVWNLTELERAVLAQRR